MGELYQITPFLHVPDLPKALHLLTEILGFTVKYAEPSYAYLEWERAALRVLEEPGRKLPAPGEPRMTVYLDVPDVDALYARLRPGLATLPPED
ncbi:MAG TPA: VOC family protein, partial [Holophagaceae bacterium]|nr:VOC family protein [Holophagaceae bacterium]